MRIIIIHRSFALTGGAERVIIDKANYLTSKGHVVKLVSYEQGMHSISYPLDDSVLVEDVDCRFFTLSRYTPLVHMYHFLKLKRKFKEATQNIFRQFRPDVIILASDWQFLIQPLLKAAGRIPVMCEFHNSYDYIVKNIGQEHFSIKEKLIKTYYKFAIRAVGKCVKLISLTENDARHWRKLNKHVSVIPNPLFCYPESIDDVAKMPNRIISVGRLNCQKRLDRLITAFSLIANQYPDWYIDIFGEGTEKETLEKQIDSLGLGKRITINPPTKNIFKEYKKAQFLVLSSEYEGRPLVLTESMTCGTPCLSFNCPSGPAEIIDDNITGLLAKNGHVKDLSEKMEWLITHDNERQEMGRKARLASEKYKPATILKEWEEAYCSINNNQI